MPSLTSAMKDLPSPKRTISAPATGTSAGKSPSTGTISRTVSAPAGGAKKNVHFHSKKQVRLFQKYAEDEHSDVWYDHVELSRLHGKDRMEVTKHQTNLGMTGKPISNDMCSTRGMEQYLQALNHVAAQNKTRKYVKAVVSAYKWQVRNNQLNPEKLQTLASTKSRKDVRHAQAVGKQDALEVRKPAEVVDQVSPKSPRKFLVRLRSDADSPNSPSRPSAKRFLPASLAHALNISLQ